MMFLEKGQISAWYSYKKNNVPMFKRKYPVNDWLTTLGAYWSLTFKVDAYSGRAVIGALDGYWKY